MLMKVAITAQGKDLQSPVDLRFGRASWFILVDLDTGEYQAIRNDQNVGLAQGAGIQSAGNVAGHAPPHAPLFRSLRQLPQDHLLHLAGPAPKTSARISFSPVEEDI